MASLTNRQVGFIGSVCFLALTYRNLDLKYSYNEQIQELEKSLERERREVMLLRRELDAAREKSGGKGLLSGLSGFLSKWRVPSPRGWFAKTSTGTNQQRVAADTSKPKPEIF